MERARTSAGKKEIEQLVGWFHRVVDNDCTPEGGSVQYGLSPMAANVQQDNSMFEGAPFSCQQIEMKKAFVFWEGSNTKGIVLQELQYVDQNLRWESVDWGHIVLQVMKGTQGGG